MKSVRVVFAFALTLAGLGTACGPEEKYCYDQHMTCKKAAVDQEAEERERKRKEEEARLDAGLGDGGAVVIDAGT
jgi:hypothetical protein